MRRSPPGSALRRSLDPQGAAWTLEADLLAGVLDRLSWLVWAKTKDGAKGRNMPKPIPRPSNQHNQAERVSDALSLDIDEVARRLALPRGPVTPSSRPERPDAGALACDAEEAARWSAP